MSLETLLSEYIFDYLRLIIVDDVTSIFDREDRHWKTNHRNSIKKIPN